MAFGLLGGEGAGDPLDLYGDLFSDKQKAALRQRELSQGLLSFAEKLGQASAPSRAPKGSFLGLLGQSLGGFAPSDEAANKQLEAMAIAEKVRTSQQTRGALGSYRAIIEKALRESGIDPNSQRGQQIVRQTLANPAAPAAPGAPPAPNLQPGGALAPAAPPAAAPPGSVPVGGVPGAYGAAGEYGAGQELPPLPGAAPGQQNTGLLPPPPGANPQMGAPQGIMSASLYSGGSPGSDFPFSGGGLPGAAGPDPAAGGHDVVIPSGPRLQRSDLTNVAAPGGGQPTRYNMPMLRSLAQSVGFQGRDADVMAATWMGESGGNPFAKNVTDREASYGLAQINARAHPGGEQAYGDPLYAARKSYELYQANKARGGSGFKDWTVYNTGAYKQYLGEGGGQGAGSGIYDPNRRIGITPLSGEAVPAGQGGVIPGLNMTPHQLGLLNALGKLGGLNDPFGSLLETYYKSPGYLTEAARARAQGENDPLIIEQKKRTEYKIDTELKPKLEVAVAWAMNAPLKERAQAEAEIARITKQYEQAGAAGTKIEEATIAGEDGKPVQKKMTALEIAIRQKVTADRQASERQATGQITVKPGDIVGTPVLSPEETARQTKRGTTAEEMREIEVWTPTGPVKQTMSNQEIAAREKLAASRGPGGAPQIGDIISKPALTPADQKIADSLGEEFIATRKQALAADKTIRDTHNLRSKLDSGMFTGLDANLNLFMAKLGDTLGWKNLSDPEKVKNTETYIAGLGSEVLAMVSALRPASNIDLDFARSMAGGQNLSAASIRQLLDMREEYARLAIQRHNEEAAGRNPAIFQGARRELPIPPAYQPKELTSPGGNKVIINR